MEPLTLTRRRVTSVWAVAVLAALTALLPIHAAHAAGTGGIEVTPLPFVVDGEQVTAFHLDLPGRGAEKVSFLLRNVEKGERTATVYSASASRLPGGGYDVGAPGSSPYLSYAKRSITLSQDAQQKDSFTVSRPPGDRPDKTVYAALVVEVSNGSVVQRAATLVYLEKAPLLPLPLAVLLAVTLVVLLGIAVPLLARRRAGTTAADDEPEQDEAETVESDVYA